ncbi:glucose dehydrogenase [FAD, quinone]-like [Oppia nitens]|uniref:glucose dehydrogenase [FAD, quinone]-like n=1 Tax=Oppia nitens TaxID=1686743 RepID=UPI0023D99583|nr:glucose dehydrogenase [FAD, quinone]-like [Oppia nitens]
MRLSDVRTFVFSIFTYSSIIYYKQKSYDKISARNEWKTFYDYIIVGAGTSGSVVAARLSEDPKVTVLLIEAGGSETVVSNTPGLSDSLLNTIMDWKFMSIPQNESCLSMNDHKCVLSSGRVVGGTSSINRMIYLRGNPIDFDNWEKSGLKGWSWRDVFPFFIRAENQSDAELSKSGYYGVNGPLVISNNNQYNRLLQSWIFGSHLSGHKISDLNADYLGASVLQTNTREGRRVSTATAYLEPNIDRPNLHILANALVTQILFENNTAIGVNFIRNWHNFAVYAKQEVIISAGTINSAKLMMLSGIGPKPHLEEHKIPVISDLPVGLNFHDHIGSYGLHFTVNSTLEEPLTVQSLNQYFNSGKGPLSQSKYAATILQSKYTNSNIEWPDIMLMTSTTSPGRETNGDVVEQRIGLKKEVWNQFYGPYSSSPQFTVWPILLRPKSRGWVRLSSANPLDQPLIHTNYLSDSSDLNILVEAMKESMRIVNSKPLQQLSPIPFVTLVPGCEPYLMNNQSVEPKETFNETLFTESYIKCMIKSLTLSTGDYVGTCRMGSDESADKVVDSRLKVIGVNNLRVIDASVIPEIPTATTNAVTVMIAERGSHFAKIIKQK